MKCNVRHPLIHNGTHQSERLSPELLPENLQIDARDTKAFLNFAYEYAALLKYYNLQNVEEGNWQCFFSGGALGILSIISSIDLAAIDEKYCRTELEFWKITEKCSPHELADLQTTRYQELIDCIYDLARKIDQLCKAIPNNLVFKQEVHDIIQKDLIKAIINNKIQSALIKLIAYDKANRPPQLPQSIDDDPFLESKYSRFIASAGNNSICTQAWGLGSLDDFFCIKPDDGFIESQLPDHCKENRKLRKLFFLFFQALSKIVQRAEYYLKLELQNNSAQEPHVSLYLAFVFLFRRLNKQLNQLTEAHLDFYYEQVLRLSAKELAPDQVYVIFELAKGFDNFNLLENTPLDAGNDAAGNKLEYLLDHNIVVDRAKVEACHTSLLKTNQNHTAYESLYSQTAEQVGNSLTNFVRWEEMTDPLLANKIKAEVGIAISDPILKLADGTRFIVLEFETSVNIAPIRLSGLVKVYLSSDQAPNGWLSVQTIDIGNPDGIDAMKGLSVPRSDPRQGLSTNVAYAYNGNQATITSAYDSIAFSSFIAHAEGNKVEIRILLKKNDFPINLPKEGDPLFQRVLFPILKVTFPERLQEIFKINGISNIRITTESAGVEKGVLIKNKLGTFNNQTTFPFLGIVAPVRAQPNAWDTGAFVEFEVEEMYEKQIFGIEPFPHFTTTKVDDNMAPLPQDLIKEGADNRRFIPKFRLAEDLKDYHADKKNLPQLPGFNDFEIDLGGILNLPIPIKANQELQQTGILFSGLGTGLGAGLGNNITVNPLNPGLSVSSPPLRRGLGGRTRASTFSLDFPGTSINSNLTTIQRESRQGSLPGTPPSPGRNYSRRTVTLGPAASPSPTLYSALKTRNILTLEYNGNNPYFQDPAVKLVKGVSFRYTSVSEFIKDGGGNFYQKKEFKPFFITPNGYNPINSLANIDSPLPEYHLLHPLDAPLGANDSKNTLGYLDIGIRDLRPGQQLSLLFEMEEGTGNPDFDPPFVKYYYLAKDEDQIIDGWRPFPLGSVFFDSTSDDPENKTSLLQTGLLILTTSPEMTNLGTTILPGSELYWIRAVLFESSDNDGAEGRRIIAMPNIRSIRAQAAMASLHNRNNILDHLPDGLPIGRISKLVNQVQPIKAVEQPLKSFDGRLPENRNAFYRRISERLRHKDRAINIWDYERLILEQFPEVIHAKAIPHTNKNCEIVPGRVMVAVFPDIKKRTDLNPLTPGFAIGRLEAIEDFLRERSNLFLYCNENIQVVNPFYELIKVKACIRFKPEFSPSFYAVQLNQDLHEYLAPWVLNQNVPPHFSGILYTSAILNFMEEREYVDVVSHFSVYHFKFDLETLEAVPVNGYDLLGEAKPVTKDPIQTLTPRSILTTFPEGHDILIWGESECKDCKAEAFTSFETCI